MPTFFNEPIPSSLVTYQSAQHSFVLPSRSDQVELEDLPYSAQQEYSSAFAEKTSSGDSFEEKEEIRELLPKRRPSSLSFGEASSKSQSLSDQTSPRESDAEHLQMGRRKQSPRPQTPSTSPSRTPGVQNGKINGNMESHLEMRRKHPSLDSPAAAPQTAHLMSRESFSLDNEPPLTPMTPNPNTSFFQLPRQDRRNFLLLVLLYFLQGIPMGLASGSVPFLLKTHLSYGQIGVFSLASYPYSLKLLWSPIVDAVWSPVLGRRKSWIMPIQLCSGFGMLYLGSRIKEMMVAAGASDGSGVWAFTWWWFFLVFLCATQDIAVDGKEFPSPIFGL